MNLMDLAVKITADDQASAAVAKITGGIKTGLAAAAKVGAAATAAMAAATTAAGVGFIRSAKSVAEYGDNIDKMSQKMGMSATAYQEWDSVMRHSGTSMETMKASMKTLANAAETGNEAFQRIGITQEQLASMSQEELFAATIEGLQNADSETERTYLAGQLLGRGATELGALLNTSAEDTQRMKDRVHELGAVMSDEAVKASAAFQDSLQDMQDAFAGLKNRMMSEFLPTMTTVMDGLQEVFAGNYDEGLEKISEGVSGTVQRVSEVMPQVMEVGGQIISTLITAISENLPSIIEGIVNLVMTIASAIVENIPLIVSALVECIPMLLEGGLQLFLGLLQALTEAMPQIIDGLVDAVIKLVELLPQYLPQMIEAASRLFMAILIAIVENLPEILQGLIGALVDLVAAVVDHAPEMLEAGAELIGQLLLAILDAAGDIMGGIDDVINDAIDGVADFAGDMLDAGADFIWGFIDGIGQAAGDVIDAAVGAVSDAVDGVLDFLGIASPSKLMMRFGGFTMEGFAEGIEDAAKMAEDAMSSVAADVYGAAEGTIAVGAETSYAANQAPQIIIRDCEFNVRDDNDIEKIAEAIGRLMNRQMAGGFAVGGVA